MSIRPDAKLRKRLGEQLGMTPRAVQIWFQNRRAKVKKITGKLPKKKIKNVEDEGRSLINEDEDRSLIENRDLVENRNLVEVFDTNGMYSKYQYNEQIYSEYPSSNKQIYSNEEYLNECPNEYNNLYPNVYNQYSNYLIKNRSYNENLYSYNENLYSNNENLYSYNENLYPNNENRPPLYYEDVPPYPYPSDYSPSDFVYSPEYYHKHHDEYYHNVYLDENKEGSNVGYPPQYVDMKYYKDYFYKHNYPESEDKEKK